MSTSATCRELCARATPGPRKLDGNYMMDKSGRNSIAIFAEGWSDDEANMQLCARLSPEVVLAAYLAMAEAFAYIGHDISRLSLNETARNGAQSAHRKLALALDAFDGTEGAT